MIATAYHEAGHAVVGWSQRLELQSITIVPDAVSDGHVVWRDELEGLGLENLWGEKLDDAKREAERLVVSIMAGPAAQYRFNPASWEEWQDR